MIGFVGEGILISSRHPLLEYMGEIKNFGGRTPASIEQLIRNSVHLVLLLRLRWIDHGLVFMTSGVFRRQSCGTDLFFVFSSNVLFIVRTSLIELGTTYLLRVLI